MQLDTVLKFGSLALNVAQDQNVRQLITMLHNGARRRGLIGPIVPPGALPSQPQTSAQPAAAGAAAHPIPFAPAPSVSQVPQVAPDLGKYLTKANAKRVLGFVGQMSSLLLK